MRVQIWASHGDPLAYRLTTFSSTSITCPALSITRSPKAKRHIHRLRRSRASFQLTAAFYLVTLAAGGSWERVSKRNKNSYRTSPHCSLEFERNSSYPISLAVITHPLIKRQQKLSCRRFKKRRKRTTPRTWRKTKGWASLPPRPSRSLPLSSQRPTPTTKPPSNNAASRSRCLRHRRSFLPGVSETILPWTLRSRRHRPLPPRRKERCARSLWTTTSQSTKPLHRPKNVKGKNGRRRRLRCLSQDATLYVQTRFPVSTFTQSQFV